MATTRLPFRLVRHMLGHNSLTNTTAPVVLDNLALSLPIRYVDPWETFVVVDKPPGVSCIEASYKFDSVRVRLQASHPWQHSVWFPHRLDKHARGLMAVAFTRHACSELASSLVAGHWHKKYRVLASIPPRSLRRAFRNPLLAQGEGKHTVGGSAHSPLFDPDTGDVRQSGVIRSFIGVRSPQQFPHPSVRASTLRRAVGETDTATKPRWSVTRFNLLRLDEDKGLGLYDVELDTGRTHQIRIHFAESGAPLVHDWYYNPACAHWKPDQPFPGNLCLHAYTMRFPMPRDPPHMPTHLDLTGRSGTRVTRFLRRRRARWHALSDSSQCVQQDSSSRAPPLCYPEDYPYVSLSEPMHSDFDIDAFPARWWDVVMKPSAARGLSGSVTSPHSVLLT